MSKFKILQKKRRLEWIFNKISRPIKRKKPIEKNLFIKKYQMIEKYQMNEIL